MLQIHIFIANLTNAAAALTNDEIDFLSNGFKINGNSSFRCK